MSGEWTGMELVGQRALVTGASRGMGRHFVSKLVAAGVRVGCLARPSAELDALVTEHGDAVIALPCDVSDPDETTRSVEAAASAFGGLDILINNAAIFEPFLLERATDEQVLRHLSVNIAGPVWCMRAATPHLRRSRGQIVSISSETVRLPYPYLGVYAATKAALETLSAAMRQELQQDGIRVSVLRSGVVAGGSGRNAWDPALAQEFFETITRTGHARLSGASASPESMAEALISVLRLPRDVNADLIELRSANAGVPDAVKQAL